MLRLALLFATLAGPALAAEVTVFAAASLKTALDPIAAEWQAATGTTVRIAYGGSAAMARQIAEGAPADLFISAAPEWMDALEAERLIVTESRRDLLGNSLILVAHDPIAPRPIDGALDLGALLDGGRLSMALVDAVPAGQYGRQALETLGLWEDVQDRLAQSDNVRSALKLVELGEAPLGIVYASDAIASPGVTVVGTFPETSHPPIRYPAALTVEGARPEAAAFLDHLESLDAETVFVANGFRPL